MGVEKGREHNRRAFLGQMGKTLGVGVGLALLPHAALAASERSPLTPHVFHCCVNDAQCGDGCSAGRARFYCTSSGCPPFCTACRDATPSCFDQTLPSC